MRPARDKLFDRILSLRPAAKYDLTSSRLSELDPRAMAGLVSPLYLEKEA